MRTSVYTVSALAALSRCGCVWVFALSAAQPDEPVHTLPQGRLLAARGQALARGSRASVAEEAAPDPRPRKRVLAFVGVQV